jgi:hypothetical protein
MGYSGREEGECGTRTCASLEYGYLKENSSISGE